MQIVTPVTDYIPASLLTTNNDLVERLAGVNARRGTRSWLHVALSAQQNITKNVWTKCPMNLNYIDTNSEYDEVTDFDWTAGADKTVLVLGQVYMMNMAADKLVNSKIMLDETTAITEGGSFVNAGIIAIEQCFGIAEVSAGETLTLWVMHMDSVDRNLGPDSTEMWIIELI